MRGVHRHLEAASNEDLTAGLDTFYLLFAVSNIGYLSAKSVRY